MVALLIVCFAVLVSSATLRNPFGLRRSQSLTVLKPTTQLGTRDCVSIFGNGDVSDEQNAESYECKVIARLNQMESMTSRYPRTELCAFRWANQSDGSSYWTHISFHSTPARFAPAIIVKGFFPQPELVTICTTVLWFGEAGDVIRQR